jgi:AGCS family alanine or glycine:cation symporter
MGDALIYLCLGTGLYFSIRTRFCRYIKEMFRLLFDGKSSESGVSSFRIINVWQVEWVRILQV